jgi:hypothetical protein
MVSKELPHAERPRAHALGLSASNRSFEQAPVQASFTLPPQSECPHKQTISIFLPIPSQCGLQYLAFPGGTQVQDRLPNFFGLAIILLPRIIPV